MSRAEMSEMSEMSASSTRGPAGRRPRPRFLRRPHATRQDGIALMVVFVLFTILILVVTQLQFSTKLEEELAEVRATDSMGSFAIASLAAHIMTLLAEDFRESKIGAGQAGGAPAGMAPPSTTAAPGQPAPETDVAGARGDASAIAAALGAPGGAAAGGGAAGADPGTFDYILKRIFSPDTKSINGVTVKFVLTDNERRFNLNRLWGYPRVVIESISDQDEASDEADAGADANNGEDGGEDPAAQDDTGADPGVDPGEILERAMDAAEGLNRAAIDFVPPGEEKRQLVREMLTRAIDLMMRLNEDAGFYYQFQMPQPADVATAIEDYCYQRRSEPGQNSINLVSEILNIPGIPPELYYGPNPQLRKDEEFWDSDQMFLYRRDEFGDLVGEAQFISDEWLMEREERAELLDEYMANADSPFQSFAGLGALGNPLTRSMQEYPEDLDGEGLLVPPMPIGLRDLFCTHSTGKININTAPAPVIYGLLLSLDDADAEKVSLDLEAYRYRYQEIADEEEADGGVGGVEDRLNLGQPRRQPPPDEDELAADGAGAGTGGDLEDGMGEDLTGLSSLENPETNYFTDLRQLVLIDGEEGDGDDLLRLDDGVERVGADFKSPFQNARDDLAPVAVFGSTYFTATLKIKTEKSPVVKEGTLLIHRDVQNRRIEIILWKELEK